MPSDLIANRSYSDLMGEDGAHITLDLDTDEPIALNDFVGAFVGLGNQIQKFVAAEHPELRSETEIFVKEVRRGSVQADLIPVFGALASVYGVAGLPGMIDAIDKGQILAKFVCDLRDRISHYFVPGGRDPSATKSDLADFGKILLGIARDPRASANIAAAALETDGKKVRAAFQFTTPQARAAQAEITEHRKELEAKSDTDHQRVLLQFVRPSIESGKPGKRGGERGIIASIHKRALPVLYASGLAEERMRHEKMQLQGNVFRAMFDVSVNVELSAAGKPAAYRITEVHAVIDSPDDEEPSFLEP